MAVRKKIVATFPKRDLIDNFIIWGLILLKEAPKPSGEERHPHENTILIEKTAFFEKN